MKVVLLLFATLLTPAVMRSATTLPVSVVDKRPFVQVRINGKGPFSFLVDTGSSVTTISADLAERLRLRPLKSDQGSGAGNEAIKFQVVHVDSVDVGSVSLGPMDVPAIDETRLSQVVGFRSFDGVLGAEIFKTYEVTLDTFRGRLTLDRQRGKGRDTGTAIPFLLDENDMPVVHASVNGVTGSFQVDTGDRSSLTLFGSFWRKNDLDKQVGPTIRTMTGYGVGGPILSIVGRSKDVRIASITLPPPVTRLSLQTGGSFTRADRAGSIGMGILSRFEVTFDYLHHVMWLSKGPGFEAPDRYDRSGLWLGLTGGIGLRVVAVAPGSPAEQAGIRVDDVVNQLGTIEATGIHLFAVRRLLEDPHVRVLPVSGIRGAVPYKTVVRMQDQIQPQ